MGEWTWLFHGGGRRLIIIDLRRADVPRGSAEVQRLTEDPHKGRNWVGSVTACYQCLVVGLGPVCSALQQEP